MTRLEYLYPDNKHPEFDRVNEELKAFDDSDEARKIDDPERA